MDDGRFVPRRAAFATVVCFVLAAGWFLLAWIGDPSHTLRNLVLGGLWLLLGGAHVIRARRLRRRSTC